MKPFFISIVILVALTGCSSINGSALQTSGNAVNTDLETFDHEGAMCPNIKMACDVKLYRDKLNSKGRLLCSCDA